MRSQSAFLSLALAAIACGGGQVPADSSVDSTPGASAAPHGRFGVGSDTAILVGAGDIASCEYNGAQRTARLLDSIPGTVFVAGDAAYGSAAIPNPFATCYDSTWGRHKARTRPVLGNHDYEVTGTQVYFDYFGQLAGPKPDGYYSFEAGSWHVIALNTNIAMAVNSPEFRWLRADLAAHRGQCTVAFMHHPRWSSGPHTDHTRMIPFWDLFTSHGVSVVVAGHDHLYERFEPMNVSGKLDTEKGTRQFVVGTGGGGHYTLGATDRGSEVRDDKTYGVLKLTLRPSDYHWEFIPVAGEHFRDSGTSACHPVT